MSGATTLLDDSFTRIGDGVASVVDGLSPEGLSHRLAPGANTIGWLVWHLLRVQDDHVADVAGTDQVWTSGGWFDRFDLPFEPGATATASRPMTSTRSAPRPSCSWGTPRP